jgi:hypothetical protein
VSRARFADHQYPAYYTDQAQQILFDLRAALTHGPTEAADPAQDAVRRRAFATLQTLLRYTRATLHELETAHNNTAFDAWPSDAQDQTRHLWQLLNAMSMEIYFASGAFDAHRDARNTAERPRTDAERRRFYHEAAPLIDAFAEVGHPAILHHLIETLEACVAYDPRGVLLRVGTLVHLGQHGGYQLEPMAVDHIVRSLRRLVLPYMGDTVFTWSRAVAASPAGSGCTPRVSSTKKDPKSAAWR